MNDVVLAILHLRKVFDRVLYVDIVHHGDGVRWVMPFLFSARLYVDNGDHDTGYPVHRCVCESVYICICVSCGVPGGILGIKSDFWGTSGL